MLIYNLDSLESPSGDKLTLDPSVGDTFYVKCTGGYIMKVNPKTRKCTDEKQLFKLINAKTMEIAIV